MGEVAATTVRSVETDTRLPVMGRREVPRGYNRGVPLPWWLKMAARLVLPDLARINVVPNKLRIGADDADLDHVIELFDTKLDQFVALRRRQPKTYLELGPGDSAARALVAAAHGIGRIWLVDAGNFARRDMRHYHEIAAGLSERGLTPPDLTRCHRFDDVLDACRATYLTGGLSSLREIPDTSIDLIMSEAVLEHLPRSEFASFLFEFRRLLAPDGLALHGIDFHDHLDGGLNHLRFSSAFWGSRLIRNSGFYTNRISLSQMLQMAEAETFAVQEFYRLQWPAAPVARAKLHPDVARWSDDDMTVCSAGLLLEPAKSDQAVHSRRSASES